MNDQPAFQSLRDYFAAKAMQGFITNWLDGAYTAKDVAKEAYEMADAMLAARPDIERIEVEDD